MTIKLTTDEMKAMHVVFSHYLQQECINALERLIWYHIDDINEKLRKKIRNGKENLNLDDKQREAFEVWYLYKSSLYQNCGYGYTVIMMIIFELKPQKT